MVRRGLFKFSASDAQSLILDSIKKGRLVAQSAF